MTDKALRILAVPFKFNEINVAERCAPTFFEKPNQIEKIEKKYIPFYDFNARNVTSEFTFFYKRWTQKSTSTLFDLFLSKFQKRCGKTNPHHYLNIPDLRILGTSQLSSCDLKPLGKYLSRDVVEMVVERKKVCDFDVSVERALEMVSGKVRELEMRRAREEAEKLVGFFEYFDEMEELKMNMNVLRFEKRHVYVPAYVVHCETTDTKRKKIKKIVSGLDGKVMYKMEMDPLKVLGASSLVYTAGLGYFSLVGHEYFIVSEVVQGYIAFQSFVALVLWIRAKYIE
eukprot:TRINITY_DN19633_c0_g1_i1.p1 TRINITY_DN19633_c0_g1~~TRINITY_DN19633_c0_g1_i1.p1  ORF type:complete len:285 (+),score=79.65 TRINITY_DN19633_c0_g1_i1:160-1014(+)